MSALDQAIIKAYAKDRPAAKPAVAPAIVSSSLRPAPATSGEAVEQIYRDGSLYRLHAALPAAAPPAPHVAQLPPTSPRRGVRRSVLRLLAANERSAAVETATTARPAVARKVIIRHVSHRAAPAPLGLMRPVDAPRAPQADLPPETLIEEPEAPTIPPAAPALPQVAPPQVAPLNLAEQFATPIEVQGPWMHEAAFAPMVLVADGLAARKHPAFAQHIVHVDGLAARQVEARALARQARSAEKEITLDLRAAQAADSAQRSPLKIYIEAGHALGRSRPHAKFRAEVAEAAATGPEAKLSVVADEPEQQPTSTLADQLPFAEAFEEALASDLIPAEKPVEGLAPKQPPSEPVAQALPAAEAKPVAQGQSVVQPQALAQAQSVAQAQPVTQAPSVAPGPMPSVGEPVHESLVAAVEVQSTEAATTKAHPVWEVDRFQWPRTCEKLLGDETGYLVTAGDKLLAAVQDGLRVLAITGSRRGEGRSTLALCLARAAARSGIEVAIMDADFQRPQLASKLGIETAFGWQDAALGKIPLSEAAIKSLADGITVMPLESAPTTRRLSLADARVTATIRAAAATFELLILDLGPIAAQEQLAFPHDEACPLDAAIVVRDLRFTSAEESEAVGDMLHGVGIEAVGVAENFVIDEEIPATSV